MLRRREAQIPTLARSKRADLRPLARDDVERLEMAAATGGTIHGGHGDFRRTPARAKTPPRRHRLTPLQRADLEAEILATSVGRGPALDRSLPAPRHSLKASPTPLSARQRHQSRTGRRSRTPGSLSPLPRATSDRIRPGGRRAQSSLGTRRAHRGQDINAGGGNAGNAVDLGPRPAVPRLAFGSPEPRRSRHDPDNELNPVALELLYTEVVSTPRSTGVFLAEYKRSKRAWPAAVTIQSWWRGAYVRRKYRAFLIARRRFFLSLSRPFFHAWADYARAAAFHNRSLLRRALHGLELNVGAERERFKHADLMLLRYGDNPLSRRRRRLDRHRHQVAQQRADRSRRKSASDSNINGEQAGRRGRRRSVVILPMNMGPGREADADGPGFPSMGRRDSVSALSLSVGAYRTGSATPVDYDLPSPSGRDLEVRAAAAEARGLSQADRIVLRFRDHVMVGTLRGMLQHWFQWARHQRERERHLVRLMLRLAAHLDTNLQRRALVMWHRYTKYMLAERRGLPVPAFDYFLLEWSEWVAEHRRQRRLMAAALNMADHFRKREVLAAWLAYTRSRRDAAAAWRAAVSHDRRTKLRLAVRALHDHARAVRADKWYLGGWFHQLKQEIRRRRVGLVVAARVDYASLRLAFHAWRRYHQFQAALALSGARKIIEEKPTMALLSLSVIRGDDRRTTFLKCWLKWVKRAKRRLLYDKMMTHYLLAKRRRRLRIAFDALRAWGGRRVARRAAGLSSVISLADDAAMSPRPSVSFADDDGDSSRCSSRSSDDEGAGDAREGSLAGTLLRFLGTGLCGSVGLASAPLIAEPLPLFEAYQDGGHSPEHAFPNLHGAIEAVVLAEDLAGDGGHRRLLRTAADAARGPERVRRLLRWRRQLLDAEYGLGDLEWFMIFARLYDEVALQRIALIRSEAAERLAVGAAGLLVRQAKADLAARGVDSYITFRQYVAETRDLLVAQVARRRAIEKRDALLDAQYAIRTAAAAVQHLSGSTTFNQRSESAPAFGARTGKHRDGSSSSLSSSGSGDSDVGGDFSGSSSIESVTGISGGWGDSSLLLGEAMAGVVGGRGEGNERIEIQDWALDRFTVYPLTENVTAVQARLAALNRAALEVGYDGKAPRSTPVVLPPRRSAVDDFLLTVHEGPDALGVATSSGRGSTVRARYSALANSGDDYWTMTESGWRRRLETHLEYETALLFGSPGRDRTTGVADLAWRVEPTHPEATEACLAGNGDLLVAAAAEPHILDLLLSHRRAEREAARAEALDRHRARLTELGLDDGGSGSGSGSGSDDDGDLSGDGRG